MQDAILFAHPSPPPHLPTAHTKRRWEEADSHPPEPFLRHSKTQKKSTGTWVHSPLTTIPTKHPSRCCCCCTPTSPPQPRFYRSRVENPARPSWWKLCRRPLLGVCQRRGGSVGWVAMTARSGHNGEAPSPSSTLPADALVHPSAPVLWDHPARTRTMLPVFPPQ
jgi:hypothetical protein